MTGDAATYLTAVQHLIAIRVAHLRADLAQALEDQTLPPWTEAIGSAPRVAPDKESWLDQAAVVAAFRDQCPPALDDPTRPLGPYPEPAPHTDPAHRLAHAHAALALARGYDLAYRTGQSQGEVVGDKAFTSRQVDTLRLVAADAYRALPQQQKIAVVATLFAWLGTLPAAGDSADNSRVEAPYLRGPEVVGRGHREPEELSGLEEAVTSPAVAPHLLRALQEHGILAAGDVSSGPSIRTETGGARLPRASDSHAARTRPAPSRRHPQISSPKAPTSAAPRPDYSPTEGAQPHPGLEQPRPRW